MEADQGRHVQLGIADQFGVVPGHDADHTAVVFEVGGQTTGALFNANDLSRLACLIIAEAGRIAAMRQPEQKESEELKADPIPAVSIGIGRGRSDTEAFLGLRTGNLTLTFAVDLTTLRGMCQKLAAITVATAPRKPN